MGTGTVKDRDRFWRDQLEQQKVSGLSVAAYCRRERISEASYYYWKRRLVVPERFSENTLRALLAILEDSAC